MPFLLQQMLTESARRAPSAPAVRFGDEELSYADLDALTSRAAAFLASAGVRPGDRVGIYINKSIPSIVSLLSILKAGAAYVPLDPGAPPKRLAYIIDNCGIRCLMISSAKVEKLSEMFPESSPLETVVLTDDGEVEAPPPAARLARWEEVRAWPEASAPPECSIDTDLAYILYTSGSTGMPKGVMITHRNALAFVDWAAEALDIGPADRLSNHAPLHFDLSILDIFAALKAGACVLPVPEGLSMFPFRLAEWIDRNRISIWYSVPSILSMLVNHGKLERFAFADLRRVLFAGEVFPTKYLRALMQAVPHPDYFNLYGPTETNVITFYKVASLAPDRTRTIPIGTACANVGILVVDESGAVVTEPGARGELLARGSCVAAGYWGDAEKTGRAFAAGLVTGRPDERVYRTGDIVALDADGNYEYLGRSDHQIKSRGYRIELGEIEAVLYSHPETKEAAVIAVPDDEITNRIHAFLVCRSGDAGDASDFKSWCAARLPRYMIPESITFRDALPKTSTGKVDKVSLSAIQAAS